MCYWMGTKQAKKLGNVLDRARVHSELACPTEWPGALFLRLWIDSGALSVCFFYKLYILTIALRFGEAAKKCH